MISNFENFQTFNYLLKVLPLSRSQLNSIIPSTLNLGYYSPSTRLSNIILNVPQIQVSNGLNSLCLYFHCTSWLMTSIIRYIYIFHDVWIHNVMPSVKVQSFLVVTIQFAMTIIFVLPFFLVMFNSGMIKI